MADEVADAFFVEDGDRYVATEWTRGPWSRDHQHAGPPAALLGRAVERAGDDPGMLLVRLSIDLLRPIPIAPLQVRARLREAGRNAQRLDATLEHDGQELARATALRLRRESVDVPEPVTEDRPTGPEAAAPFRFPFFEDEVGYHEAMELRIAEGTWGKGPVAAWMRCRKALVAGEPLSPLSRVLVAADSGNGVSPILDPKRTLFMNPDLTVHLERMPDADWVCLDARTRAEPHGMGLADTRLLDERGPIGRGVQSLLIRDRT